MKMVYFECFMKSFFSTLAIMIGLTIDFFIFRFLFRKDLPKMKKIFWEFVTYWNEKRERELSDDGK